MTFDAIFQNNTVQQPVVFPVGWVDQEQPVTPRETMMIKGNTKGNTINIVGTINDRGMIIGPPS